MSISGILVWLLIFLICVAVPLTLSVISFAFMIKKKKNLAFEVTAFMIGSLESLLFYGFLVNPQPWEQPMNVYGTGLDFELHEPVRSEHMLTLLAFLTIGFFCYLILKYAEQHLPPLVSAACMGGLFLGFVFNLVLLIQLLSGIGTHEFPTAVKEIETFRVNETGSILILCIVPIHFLLLSGQLIRELLRKKREELAETEYENTMLKKCNRILQNTKNWNIAALFMMLPLFLIIMGLLVLCGQKPDSAILAFTETSDWLLSGQIAPPAVAWDTHYLCTVSLRGHRKLVKPLRYGMRHEKEKIVVNRQLMVANAFEDLLMEKTPRFHRHLRHFYDTYGYPISKHIGTAWMADVVYLLMKPLEWLFVLILYTFDTKPENRIAMQYILGEIRKKIQQGF